MKSSIFWDITPRSPLKVNRRFALFATCFHAGFLLGLFFDPEMEATSSSATSVDFQQTTRRYISEDGTLQVINCWASDWDPIPETILGPIQPRTYWGLGIYLAINHSLRSIWVNYKFWEELMAHFPLIRHGPQKTTRPTIILLLRVHSLQR
jgi:hypothetical protein